MSNLLTHTATRLDLPRSMALVEPVLERRARPWGERKPGEADDIPEASAENPSVQESRQTPAASPSPSAVEQKPEPARERPTPSPQRKAEAPKTVAGIPPVKQDLPQAASDHATPGDGPAVKQASPPNRPAGTAMPRGAQAKTAPPQPQPGRAAPPDSTTTQPQRMVAAPTVRLAGFAEAGAEHSAANENASEPRVSAAAFEPAVLASDSPARRGPRPNQTAAAVREQDDSNPLPATPVKILSKPQPCYPSRELERGVEGDVLVDVEFRYSGILEVLSVRQGLSAGLNESAIEAARKIRFLPARRDGRPVDTKATVCIRFQLAP